MSTLNVANITDGTDTVETGYVVNGSAKAYVRYTLPTTVYGSFNITSLTDRASGLGRASFTSAMADGDEYTVVSGGAAGAENTTFIWWEGSAQTTAQFDWSAGTNASGGTSTLVDASAGVVVHGDLA